MKAKITDKDLMTASCEALNALYTSLLAINPKAADVVRTIMAKKACPIGSTAGQAGIWL